MILSEIESEGIFSDWSSFNAPMDTGTQNYLKCSYYLHAYVYPCNYSASCKMFQKVYLNIYAICDPVLENWPSCHKYCFE